MDPLRAFIAHQSEVLEPSQTTTEHNSDNAVNSRISFKTKYNIQVEATEKSYSTVEVSIQLNQAKSVHSAEKLGDRFRYWIQLNWQTMYLSYAPDWPWNPADKLGLESEEIKERYSELYPFYSQWVASGESLSKYPRTMMVGPERVAWQINGFLMSCWLVAQENVDSVVFEPSADVKHTIRVDNAESELLIFLRDKQLELPGESQEKYIRDRCG